MAIGSRHGDRSGSAAQAQGVSLRAGRVSLGCLDAARYILARVATEVNDELASPPCGANTMIPHLDLLIYLVPGLGMMLVAVVAVVEWYRISGVQARWFWVGAGLWTIAVVLKLVCALLTNAAVLGFLKGVLPHALFVVGGGLYVGVQSSLFEMGFTLLAGLLWRQLGKDSARAIAIGVGAGAFEAFLLGFAMTAGITALLFGAPGTENVGEQLKAQEAVTPLLWLAGPVERIIAVLVHASTRGLILLGITFRKPLMVFWGFLIFTSLDGVAGAALVSGSLGTISAWWIELALLPFALISVPILRWCSRRFPSRAPEQGGTTISSEKEGEAESDIARSS